MKKSNPPLLQLGNIITIGDSAVNLILGLAPMWLIANGHLHPDQLVAVLRAIGSVIR